MSFLLDPNGHLFDPPYVADLFASAFGLIGVGGGGTPAIDHAICVLGDMWRVTSCNAPPASN